MTWFLFCYWYEPDAPHDPVGLVRIWRLADTLAKVGDRVTVFPPRYRSALIQRTCAVIPIHLRARDTAGYRVLPMDGESTCADLSQIARCAVRVRGQRRTSSSMAWEAKKVCAWLQGSAGPAGVKTLRSYRCSDGGITGIASGAL